MGRIARVVVPGIPHHVVQRGNNRAAVFVEDGDRRFYVRRLREQAERFGLIVLGYCLMTNHVHLVAVPRVQESLAKAVGRTHFGYTQWFNDRYGRSGHLWQNRFYSCPLDQAHESEALVYVEHNPVRAGIVRQPWEYEWSSARVHVGGPDPAGVLNLEWWRERWDAPTWRQLLEDTDPDERFRALRSCTNTGRPLGSDGFVATLEAVVGRPLRARPRGRPRRKENGDSGLFPMGNSTRIPA